MESNLIWAASGIGKGNLAGITLWCVCGVNINYKLPVDSKDLVNQLLNDCIWSLGVVTPEEIDTLDNNKQVELVALLKAFRLLKQYEIQEVHGDLWLPNLSFYEGIRLERANEIVLAVRVAEIIVQYAMDLYWQRINEHYPEYKFPEGINKKKTIEDYGLIPNIHRLGYKTCQKYIGKKGNKR